MAELRTINSTSFESYAKDGCGRCDKFQTPACKVLRWTPILEALRSIVLKAGLTEEMKWGSPCYTLDGKNVVMIGSLVDACVLSFFKGSILDDPDGVLESAGPNSHVARLIKFRSVSDFEAKRASVVRLVDEAIAAERAGAKVAKREAPEPMPEELKLRLESNGSLKRAFEAMTPGRQRSHILHVSGAKQAATREDRAAKCEPKILAGKGWNER